MILDKIEEKLKDEEDKEDIIIIPKLLLQFSYFWFQMWILWIMKRADEDALWFCIFDTICKCLPLVWLKLGFPKLD